MSTQLETDVAVIGMAGRFPGARTPGELWQNVRDGIESIRRLTDDELRRAGIGEDLLAAPNYVKACAPLEDVASFDGAFFGFSARESDILDPQHRHFLECSWEALESAGYPPERFDGSIGVFAGCGQNSYYAFNLLSNPDLVKSVGLFLLRHTGNDKDFLPTRVSYLLNLTGPSIAVQTACSTSLVAIHLAAQHLINGECDMALAGGVTIEVPHGVGYLYESGEILSPDGHCRAFDAAAQGTVFGSGVGIVVLRRLRDALDAGDTVHAVVRGSAVNNDGGAKVGYLAPSVEGQSASVLEALAVAGVTADQVSYVEAHGTGTPVGDPIEVTALTQAFRQHTSRRGFCGIGSLKANIGHLDTAAGVANFIKVVQALKNKQLPPSLHFSQPNPTIDFASSPFYVNAALEPWPAPDGPRIAGVSSLGVGGTNAHVVVQEAPAPAPEAPGRSSSVLLLSAKTQQSLDTLRSKYARHLTAVGGLSLADAAFTTAVGRRSFEHRYAVVGDTTSEVAEALTRGGPAIVSGAGRTGAPSVVMLFPGGGAQYPSMGADLYREEPRYRADVDRCLSIAESLGHVGLGRLMFPPAAEARDAAALLERPGTSILSVFVTEYALARLWMSWGIQPAAYIGHSLGEYVAACLAGVMTLESALALVAKRGAIFERLPEGGMLSVSCNERALRELPEAKALAVAAVNASELTVASGAVNDLAALEAALTSRGIESRRLHISVAAHSSMLDPFLDEFGAFLRTIPLMPPTQRFISNVTGSWVDGREVATPEYWVRHLRNTVRFSDGLTTILREPNGLLLEVGPGQSLTALARLNRVNGQVPDVFPSLRQPREAVSDLKTIYLALARLWVEGCPIDWNAVYEGQTRRRVDLPTYAFDRQHHWIAPGRTSVAERPESTTPPLLPRSNSIDDWAYTPTWQALPEPAAAPASRETWLVFARGARGRAFAAALRARGDSVTTVTPGVSFAEHTAGFVVRPKLVEDYRALWHALDNSGRMPSRIAYLWLADEADDDAPLDSSISPSATALFEAQFAALQALAENAGETAVQILTVTSGLFSVMGEAVQRPEQALLHGVALVMPREYPMWRCRVIDVAAPGAAESDATSREWAVQLLREASRHDAASLVALRNGRAWLRLFERQPLPDGGRSVAFREGGVYLIAGGLGGMALTIARHLADRYQAKLGLVSRHLTADRIAVTDELATRGARVLPLAADVSVPQDIARAVGELERSYGPINGVIHAAGVLDDGLLAMRSTEQAQAVLMPKVQGALALDNALSGRNLDFFVVCSSMSALVGLPGQIDYAAANAFLDSFAEHRSRWAKGTTLSINWGTWRDVGMAHRAMSRVAPQSSGITTPRDHPLLGRVTSSSESTIEFELRANAHDLWVLSEHRLRDGTPMFPGSAYVELLRAAGEVASGAPVVELENLTFVEALDVTQPRTIRTRLERRDTDGWEAVVESAADALGSWTEHARADVKGLATVSHAAVEPLSAVQARLLPTLAPTDRDVWEKQSKHMAFGPRWNVLDALHVGKNEALARLSLDRRFAADLQIWRLHPALLDLATAAGLSALPDYAACDDFFVPLAYARVVAASFDRELWAHTRLAPGSEGAETVTLDVTIFDAEGHAVATIEGFTMRRLEPRQFTASRATREARKPVPMTPAALSASLLDRGISAAEGAVALERVLAANLGPHVVLSPIDLSALAAAVDRVYPARTTTSPGGSAGAPLGARKSSLDPVESAIAELWEELLGGVEFSVDDDFFKLGGHSLTAVRLITRMERTFHAGLRVSAIFEAPTIRQLAALVRTSVHNRGTPPGTTDTMQVTTQPAAKPVPPLVAVSREAFLVSHTTWTDDEHDA